MRLNKYFRKTRTDEPISLERLADTLYVADRMPLSGSTKKPLHRRELSKEVRSLLDFNLSRKLQAEEGIDLLPRSFDAGQWRGAVDDRGNGSQEAPPHILVEWLEALWGVSRKKVANLEIISSRAINIPAIDVVIQYVVNFTADIGYLRPGATQKSDASAYDWRPFNGQYADELALRIILNRNPPGVDNRKDLVGDISFPGFEYTEEIEGETLPADVAAEEVQQELADAMSSARFWMSSQVERRLPGDVQRNIKYDIENVQQDNLLLTLPFWFYEFTVGNEEQVETALVSRINPMLGASPFVARSRGYRVLIGIAVVIVIGVVIYLTNNGS